MYVFGLAREMEERRKKSRLMSYISWLFWNQGGVMTLGNQIGKLAFNGWRNWKLHVKHGAVVPDFLAMLKPYMEVQHQDCFDL